MTGMEKRKKSWNRLISYVKSHIWISLTASMILLFLGLAVIFQNYLKNEYFHYLLAETQKSEQTLLTVSSRNLNGLLLDILNVGSEAAINKKLYNVVKRATENGGNSRLQSEKDLTLELTNISRYAGNIAAVSIVTSDGLLKEYGRYWTGGNTNFWIGENRQILKKLYSDVMERLQQDVVGRYCISTQPAFHKGLPDMRLIHVALPLVGRNTSFDNVSQVIVFSFRLDNIVQSSGLVNDSSQNYTYAYLTDKDDIIIYHTAPQYIGMPEEEYLREMSIMERHQSLDYFGWKAHILIDVDRIDDNVNRMYREGLIVYMILLMLCVLIWQMLVRGGILSPVASIRNAMEKIGKGKLNEKIEIKGSHELWQLAMEYNDMVDALVFQTQETQRFFAEKMQSIERRNQAERSALESQINAHFICNTLNAINYNVMAAGNDEVSRLLKNLANILHYTFSNKTKYVTLGQELEWVQQYLCLQKFRLMERFEYEIDFPKEYSEWPCCKLFLQPFVENSIIHGFENIEQGGIIRITGCAREDRFVISIWDNGCGIRQEVKQRLQNVFEKGKSLKLADEGCGIGIPNVIARMRMYFGERFEACVETEEGKGTCFTFWLPIPEASKEDSDI